MQEERYVRQFVTEGPVVRRRLVTHAYQQLPGTSVRYVQPMRGDTSESLQQNQQQVVHQYTVQQQHGGTQGVIPAGAQGYQTSGSTQSYQTSGPVSQTLGSQGYQTSGQNVQVRHVQLPAEGSHSQHGSVTTVTKEMMSGGGSSGMGSGEGHTTRTVTRTVQGIPASTLEGGVVVIEEGGSSGGGDGHTTVKHTRTVTQSFQEIPVTQQSFQITQQSMPVITQQQRNVQITQQSMPITTLQQGYHTTQQQSMPMTTQQQGYRITQQQSMPITTQQQGGYQITQQQSMPMTTQHQQQQSYHITQQQSTPMMSQQQGGVTVVRQVVRGGSREGSAGGTVRRGFQQVEMMEGMTTEELSKQMERMIGDPQAGWFMRINSCVFICKI